jgi:hypothetical protein
MASVVTSIEPDLAVRDESRTEVVRREPNQNKKLEEFVSVRGAAICANRGSTQRQVTIAASFALLFDMWTCALRFVRFAEYVILIARIFRI